MPHELKTDRQIKYLNNGHVRWYLTSQYLIQTKKMTLYKNLKTVL